MAPVCSPPRELLEPEQGERGQGEDVWGAVRRGRDAQRLPRGERTVLLLAQGVVPRLRFAVRAGDGHVVRVLDADRAVVLRGRVAGRVADQVRPLAFRPL